MESVGDEFSVLCAADTGRVDGQPLIVVGSCYQRVLTHILKRRLQFTSWIRHQVKMTVLHVLYTGWVKKVSCFTVLDISKLNNSPKVKYCIIV